MIRDNQKYFNRLQVLVDAIVIAISYVLAWIIRFKTGWFYIDEGVLPVSTYFIALIGIVPVYLILYYACNLYTAKRVQGRRLEGANIFKANTLGLFLFLAVLYTVEITDFARTMIFIFFGINLLLELITRNFIRHILRRIRKKGYNQKHMLLVGYSRASEEYIDRILHNPQWGYMVRGILDDNVESGTMYKGIKVIGSIDNLPYILPENKLDEIAITLSIKEYDKLEHIVALCEKSGVHTKFIPDYNKIIPTRPYTEDLIGLPVINIRHVPLTNTFNMLVKRLMDITGALMALLLFSIPMAIVAIIIKLTSKGPLVFKQERVGLHNASFNMYKFRSMEIQIDLEEKKAWTVQNDPRVTTIGKFIRKTSMDELPQLFNVLKGNMSLVGPRPERPHFVEKFREEIPRYMIKHQVRPGMTGWAQINGYRGDTSIKRRIEHDLYYIENWSVGLDIKILILTVFRGFVNKNAY